MKTFTPTQPMIKSAETVFLAMAMVQAIRPVVLKYQTEILAEGKWCVRDEFSDKPVNEVIIDPKRAWLMSDENFAVYDGKCKAARKAAGLLVDDEDKCPLLVSEHELISAETALAVALESVSPLSAEMLDSFGGQRRKDAVDLMLRLMAPYVRDDLGAIVRTH
jgi:hypothetical protein